MAYQNHVRAQILAAPNTLGSYLGRLALRIDFPVTRIAQATGATRATVYSWLLGGSVSNAYEPVVQQLIQILKAAKNADAAWSQACLTFPRLQRSPTKNSFGTPHSRWPKASPSR